MVPSSTSPAPGSQTNRPTLPPLRSLCLPDIRARSTYNMPAMTNYNQPTNDFPISMQMERPRQPSVSSSCTSRSASSRAPSPAGRSRRPHIARTIKRHHPYLRPDKCRVVLSSAFDKADAMLIFPLPSEFYDENNKPIAAKLKKYRPAQAYLVVGKLAVELRDSKNRAMFRAAIYPYRFIPRNLDDHPPSSSASSSYASPLSPNAIPDASPVTPPQTITADDEASPAT